MASWESLGLGKDGIDKKDPHMRRRVDGRLVLLTGEGLVDAKRGITPDNEAKTNLTNENLQLDRSGTNSVPSNVSVGTTSTQVLASNGSRKTVLFINDSDETIYLGLGVAAVLNRGIRLNANGGNFTMSYELGNMDNNIVYAISTTGSKNLLVTEWF